MKFVLGSDVSVEELLVGHLSIHLQVSLELDISEIREVDVV
jgi:hypothetical protein